MPSRVVSLLVGPPGALRDSLRELVAAIPESVVTVVDDAKAALSILEIRGPALVLVDFDAADPAVWTLVRALVSAHPRTRHIVLVDNVDEQRQAVSAGASVVLLKGFPASSLADVIRCLLLSTAEGNVASRVLSGGS